MMCKFTRLCAMLLVLCLMAPAGLAVSYENNQEPNPIPVLTEEEIMPTPNGMHHYMLVCIDEWNANPKKVGHTDGLILVTVDENAGRVMLTSFIRDMLIQRPDGKFGRINNIAGFFGADQSGIEALIDTINSHFGLRIEDYIVVDFGQVERIVDAVGGVDIEITDKEANYLRNYRISPSSTQPAITFGGTYHFSGHAAVIYMRIRKVKTINGSTQDVGRTERARTVLTTIADSLKDISYNEAANLLEVILDNIVMTNMTAADMMEGLTLAMQMKGTPIESIRMPIDGTYELMPVAGMATQQIDYIANRAALHDFLESFTVSEEWQEE